MERRILRFDPNHVIARRREMSTPVAVGTHSAGSDSGTPIGAALARSRQPRPEEAQSSLRVRPAR